MSRTVLINADSPVGRHASTRVLNRYPNGAQLVVTDAPVPETGESGEIAVSAGLHVDAEAAAVDRARLGVPAPETTRAHQPRRRMVRSDALVSAYVEFVGPADARWLDELRELGLQVIGYHPENSFLCHGSLSSFETAMAEVVTSSGEPAIKQTVELTAELKRRIEVISEDATTVVIVAVATPDSRERTIADIAAVDGVELLDGNGNDVLDGNRVRVRARIAADAHAALLRLAFVLSIEPFQAPVAEDEIAGLIVAGLVDTTYRPTGSYRNWLQQHSLDGAEVTIGIVDGGVDVDHPAFAGRARDLIGGQKDWHATMVAGHAAGNYLAETDSNGFIYGLGTAPAARILSQDKMQSATFLCRQTVRESSGPAIQNNSWGKGIQSPMDYGSEEALYDALVRNSDPDGGQSTPLTICFSSGNQGAQGLTRPKGAKNLIVTGNSESFRPDVGRDGSDDIREVYSGANASSHGNCGDGRIRPHVVAPGEWTASASYDCRPGDREFISPKLTWGGGSSGASPKTAGACALLTQWWQRSHSALSPSPAMLRALVVNAAEPIMTGGPIPNNRQGWGRLNVGNVIDPRTSRVVIDQTAMLAHPGDAREWSVRAVDPLRPVKITLAWTDPPGPIGTGTRAANSPIVNKLALRAVVDGVTFRGLHDRFRGGVSVADADIAPAAGVALLPEGFDNLQNIFLSPHRVRGAVKVSVTAINVTTNCLTAEPGDPRQDFALVITNATLDPSSGPSDVVVSVDHDGTSSPSTPSAPSTDDEERWWNEDARDPRPESTRSSSTPPHTELMRQIGGSISVLASNDRTLTTAIESESKKTTRSIPKSLRDAIAAIKARFERCNNETGPHACRGVVVISDGSQATAADVADLRILASTGVLYLVAEASAATDQLASRIGAQQNVNYRLAATQVGLAERVRDAVCEAGGLQRVRVAADRSAHGTTSTHTFDVVAADRAITIVVRFAGEPRKLILSRPGLSDLTWSPGRPATPTPHLTATIEDGLLRIRDARAGDAPGAWSAQITLATDDAAPQVAVWALGGPDISVREGVSVSSNANDGQRRLVKIAGGSDAQLIEATLAAAGTYHDGYTRPIVARPTPTRRDRTDVIGHPIPVPELSAMVDLPLGSGTAVVDLTIDVIGVTATAHRFSRRLNLNLFRVPTQHPLSGDTGKMGDEMLRINAQVTEVQFEKGVVSVLRLAQGNTSRVVKVATPELGRTLAGLDYNSLRGRTFTFSVDGDLLHSMFRSVNGESFRPPDAETTRSEAERGIEGPIKDVPRPISEASDTDYPLATRFVPAVSFNARPNGRTINRVVIHITDGGARIDGPISWFQNPTSRVSAHYIVGQDGEVVQMVHDQDIAWHANSANGDSIGIEHCARAPRPSGDHGLFPTPIQYEASAALVSWLCEQHGIPMDRDHILGHAEADPNTSHSACPNSVWDWDYYMEILRTSASVEPFNETQRPAARSKRPQRKDSKDTYRGHYQYR
jgi:N-acetyl-anhydromuramyl-L-alanine amidase AmpD